MFEEIADREFVNLTRSTIPLLSYWREPERALEAVAAAIGLTDIRRAYVLFEAETPSLKPKYKSSFTDVMLLSRSVAVAIEGKWSEPRYETVGEWCTSDRRRDVLRHWLALIKPYSAYPDQDDLFSDLVYQMIHRSASACAQKRENSVLIYQVFRDKARPDHYSKDLRLFVETLKPLKTFRVLLCRVPMLVTDHYVELTKQVVPNRRENVLAIRAAVCSGALFRFEQPVFESFS